MSLILQFGEQLSRPQQCLLIDPTQNEDRGSAISSSALQSLRFSVGIAINCFRIADKYDSLGRNGLCTPGVEFDGYRFGPYLMCEEEKREYAKRGLEYRQETKLHTARWVGQETINLIEKFAAARITKSYLLAWELICNFGSVFDHAYWRKCQLRNSREGNQRVPIENIPDLKAAILKMRLNNPAWWPVASPIATSERLQ